MKIDVDAFLLGVTFVQRKSGSTNVAEAYLNLEDYADSHDFRVAVPRSFALEAAKVLSEHSESEETPRITITFEVDS